jgi:pilus assembly protein FimV
MPRPLIFDFDETDQTVAALSDAVPPANMELNASFAGAEVENDQEYIEIQSKLDDFFALASVESEEPETLPGNVEAIEQALFTADESGIEPALADSEEGQDLTERMTALDATPMEEIVEKLDFFLGSEAVEEEAAVDLNMSVAPPMDALRQPDETFMASADTLEASLARIFDEEQEEPAIPPALDQFELPEGLKEVDLPGLAAPVIAANDLEGALDLFFETAAGEGREPAADTLTEALEATIAEGQAPADMGSKIQFAALGALLPMIVRTPSHERIAESAELFAALKKSGLASEQQALLQLLESVVTMLVRLPTKDAAATEKLVNYLYEHLLQEHCSPETLAEAVGRFTSWLQQAGAIMPLIPAVSGGPEQEPQFAYTAKELYFELSEMRTHIREEFKKLRHELHHHQA